MTVFNYPSSKQTKKGSNHGRPLRRRIIKKPSTSTRSENTDSGEELKKKEGLNRITDEHDTKLKTKWDDSAYVFPRAAGKKSPRRSSEATDPPAPPTTDASHPRLPTLVVSVSGGFATASSGPPKQRHSPSAERNEKQQKLSPVLPHDDEVEYKMRVLKMPPQLASMMKSEKKNAAVASEQRKEDVIAVAVKAEVVIPRLDIEVVSEKKVAAAAKSEAKNASAVRFCCNCAALVW